MVPLGAYGRIFRRYMRHGWWMLVVALLFVLVFVHVSTLLNTFSESDTSNDNTLLDTLEYDSDFFENGLGITDEEESRIASLFEHLFDSLVDSKPILGFQLQNTDNGDDHDVKNKNRFKLIQRSYTNPMVDIAYHEKDPDLHLLSEGYLKNGLHVPMDLIMDLKISHKKFMSKLFDAPLGTYKGSGYVFIGGGKFTWLSILSITNLRNVGSKLPIELIIPKESQYEENICEVILPELGGKCIKLYELMPKKYIDLIDGYQYKVLALIASSFEKVIYLDSDNIPIANPDSILINEPFNSNGLILWPDFWRRRHHPSYYEIANIKISKEVVRNMIDDITPVELYINKNLNIIDDVPLHDRKGTIPDLSTESGQLIINKKTHFKTLMLSLYYNFYGPNQFYPLFGQGGSGEGDKDTFYAAANVLGEDVYQVHRGLNAVGRFINGDYVGAAMAQYDPIQDFINLKKFKMNETHDKFISLIHYLDESPNVKMFMHCNFPKIEPKVLEHEKYLENRMYGDDDLKFEITQWKYMYQYYCLKKVNFEFLPLTNGKRSELCSKIEKRIQFIKEN